MYNIHPIVVHFPIAMLMIYFAIEIIPVHKIFKKVNWQPISDVLLIVGVLGALAAMGTGDAAEHSAMAAGKWQLVEMHATFAALTTGIGLVLVGDRLIDMLAIYITRYVNFLNSILKYILPIVRNRVVHIVLVIVGIFSLVMTGILGGAIVYGATADPLVPIVFKLLGLS
jgi:uncharacterized membrane protein